MKKFFLILLVPLFIWGLFAFSSPNQRYFEIVKNLEIFASLFKEINASYVDDVNPNKLIQGGIKTMLASLDPYTNFITEDEIENYRTSNTGQYGGIGASTRTIGTRVVVTMIYEGYPAAKKGLKIGDEITKIDEAVISKTSFDEIQKLMRGQVGSEVDITVKRTGLSNSLSLHFTREKIKIKNLSYVGKVRDDIGYIRLISFTPDASKEIESAVATLKEQHIKGLILDVRNNPGGLLLEAIKVCNIFLPKGITIVTTKGKIKKNNMTYQTLSKPIDLTLPLVVLIDRKSASASEIVSGSLQDYDRAVIIGEKSFGKGLVQLNRPLPYNATLKVTTAKYYTPSGRCIQALDYSNRRPDGSVGMIPDSLKTVFKTTHGRTVYDGGGVDPDIVVEQPEPSPFTQMLYRKGFIFDYATLFTSNRPSIAGATQFRLSDDEYKAFENWVNDRLQTYTSYTEQQLDRLRKTAEKEQYPGELALQFDRLGELLAAIRKEQCNTFKTEIKEMLEQEIIARYYLEKGAIEASFQRDHGIEKSIAVLHDSLAYKKILNIP